MTFQNMKKLKKKKQQEQNIGLIFMLSDNHGIVTHLRF